MQYVQLHFEEHNVVLTRQVTFNTNTFFYILSESQNT